MKVIEIFWYCVIYGLPALAAAILLSPTQLLKIHLQKGERTMQEIMRDILRINGWRSLFVGVWVFSIRQSLVSSTFGLTEWIYQQLALYNLAPLYGFGEAVMKAFYGALVETAFTFHLEIKDLFIKKSLLSTCVERRTYKLLLAVIVRNFLFWFAVTLGDQYQFVYFSAAIFAVLAAIISNPLDAYISAAYGETDRSALKVRVFGGLSIRIIQYVGFAVAAAISGKILTHFYV